MCCDVICCVVMVVMVVVLQMLRRRMQTTGHVDREAYLTHMASRNTAAAPMAAAPASPVPAVSVSGSVEKTMSCVFRELYSTHGWRVFFKGLSLNWIKGPIAVSISFTTYDNIKKRLAYLELLED
jgi:hypothetical protein